MSSTDPPNEKDLTNTNTVKYNKSAGSSDDASLGPPEHKLQRQLKNRHIAMIRFVGSPNYQLSLTIGINSIGGVIGTG